MCHPGSVPKPYAPTWATRGGLPSPEVEECFVCYCTRLGIAVSDIAQMLSGLETRALDVANARLGTYLLRRMPAAYEAALDRAFPRRARPALDALVNERYS